MFLVALMFVEMAFGLDESFPSPPFPSPIVNPPVDSPVNPTPNNNIPRLPFPPHHFKKNFTGIPLPPPPFMKNITAAVPEDIVLPPALPAPVSASDDVDDVVVEENTTVISPPPSGWETEETTSHEDPDEIKDEIQEETTTPSPTPPQTTPETQAAVPETPVVVPVITPEVVTPMYKTDRVNRRRIAPAGGVVDAHGDNVNLSHEHKTTVALMQDILAARANTKAEESGGNGNRRLAGEKLRTIRINV